MKHVEFWPPLIPEHSRAKHSLDRRTPTGPIICCPVCSPITYAREGAKHRKETL
jgi:hypothetical protein